MSSEEVVQAIGKLVQNTAAIQGAVLRVNGQTHAHLPESMDMLDADALLEPAEQILALSGTLEAGEEGFSSVFLEFQSNTVLTRSLKGGTLVMIADPMHKAGYRKLQIGVGHHIRTLEAAVDKASKLSIRAPVEEPRAKAEAGPDTPSPEKPRPKKQRFYRGVKY